MARALLFVVCNLLLLPGPEVSAYVACGFVAAQQAKYHTHEQVVQSVLLRLLGATYDAALCLSAYQHEKILRYINLNQDLFLEDFENVRDDIRKVPSGDFYQPKTSSQQAQQQVVTGTGPGPGMLMGTGSIGSTGPAAGEFPVRKQQMYDVFHPPPLPKTNPNAVPLNPLRARGNQPADVISLKSQNSIESILSTKSPPPPISEYNAYPKRHVPMPQAPNQTQAGVKHVPKYPSDSEGIGSGMLGMGGTGAGLYFCLAAEAFAYSRATELLATLLCLSQLRSLQFPYLKTMWAT